MVGRIRDYLARRALYASDGILRHGAVYFFFFGATTVINIGFRKYASVNLSIEDYGVFTALLAFYSILAQPFGALQMIITKKMSYHIGKGEAGAAIGYFKWIFKVFVFFSLCGVLLALILSPFLQEQYQLPTQFSVMIVIAMFFLANIANCYTGALQAFQRFGAIGCINTIAACIKLGACYILLHLFFGDIFPAPVVVRQSLLQAVRISVGIVNRFDIPMLAVFVSMGALLLLNALALGRVQKGSCAPEGGGYRLADLAREFFPIFILYLAFSFFRNIDEYMARRFLTEYDNGLYGALATVAKSTIFLIHSVNFVTFPKFASHMDDMRASRRILCKGLLISLLAILAFFMLVLIMPELLLQALTHTKYLSAAPSLKYFFLAFAPYPLIFIFIHYFIVHRDWRYAFILIASLILFVFAYELRHSTIGDILWVLGGAGYALLAFSLAYWLRRTRVRESQQE